MSTTTPTSSTQAAVSSVEEAGALLGAATTQLTSTISSTTKKLAKKDVPSGMHSSFAIYPNTCTPLFTRLKSLRNLLSSHPSPLPSAPSLLAMLMKLLSASAVNGNSNKEDKQDNDKKEMKATPMTSHAIRHLWVQCVICCHELGKDLTGSKRIDLYSFVKTMMTVATLNPKSGKAQGGTRLAALQCLEGLFCSTVLNPLLVGYSYDIMVLCKRGIQSSGHGDPYHRIYCLHLAAAVLSSNRRNIDGFTCQTYEERILIESSKLFKKGVEDKYQEVRSRAATFAMILANGVIDEKAQSPLALLEDLILVAKNGLEDECTHVSSKFAEVFARCLCVCIAHHQKLLALGRRSSHTTEGDGEAPSTETGTNLFKLQQKKHIITITSTCNSISSSLTYLAELYLKTPSFRYNYSLVILYFLKLQLGNLSGGEEFSGGITIAEVLRMVMNLVSNEFDSLGNNESEYYTIFKNKAVSDTKVYAGRILRGIVEMSSEGVQLTILHELITLSEGLTNLQLQVALSEIAHLAYTLEEAVANSIDKLLALLNKTIVHLDHGVRLESCIVYCTVVTCSTLGNQIILESLTDMSLCKSSIGELLSQPIPSCLANTSINTNKRRGFRLNAPSTSLSNSSLSQDSITYIQNLKLHQCGIHGHALLLSRLLMVSNYKVEKDAIFHIVEKFITCNRDGVFLSAKNTAASYTSMSTCIKAGYDILSSAIALGTSFIASYVELIFDLWQKSTSFGNNILCIEAVLTNIKTFLQCCNDLLTSDNLNRITILLENHFRVISELKVNTAARLDAVIALVLECFAWLPSESYPVITDDLFLFSLEEIKSSTEHEISSSLLSTCITAEDKVLDAVSPYRIERIGQCLGTTVEHHLLANANVLSPIEREQVYHSIVWDKKQLKTKNTILNSKILDIYQETEIESTTHVNMGSKWKKPPPPHPSSKIRLLDAAILLFSSTFHRQEPIEQERVMLSIEELLPQSAKGFLMSEAERRTKAKSQNIAANNIVITILSCIHYCTDGESKKKCPLWMRKAKDILFILLSSQAFLIRRAAAEGLGWLASLGFSEEEQSLPSDILHTIDQVLKGNMPDGTVRKGTYESIVSSKAGALLALGNIQRCYSSYSKVAKSKNVWSPPTMHMMTRVLATVSSTRFDNDSYLVRSCALHCMGLLMHYTDYQTPQELQQITQIIGKAASLIDDNFFSTWCIIPCSAPFERCREIFCFEPMLLSVVIRLMNIIQPKVKNDLSSVLNRFFGMVSTIMEVCDNHPFVVIEGLAFLEKVSCVKYQEKELVEARILGTALPLLKKLVTDAKPCRIIPSKSKQQALHVDEQSLLSSPYTQNALLLCLQQLMESLSLKHFKNPQAATILEEIGRLPSYLFLFLEIYCSRTQYADTAEARTLVCSREVESAFFKRDKMKREILFTINFLVLLQGKQIKNEVGKWNQRRVLLHWLLLARELISGGSRENEGVTGELGVAGVIENARALAASAAASIYNYNPPRWQVKSEACYVAYVSLSEMEDVAKRNEPIFHFEESATFNPNIGKDTCRMNCQNWIATHEQANREAALPTGLYSLSSSSAPESYPSLHLEDLITAACGASIATVDHSELPSLQNHGVLLLSQLVKQFGDAPDPEFSNKVTILQQYSSQLVSSVRHSIRVDSDKRQLSSMITSAESELLFMSGCNALKAIVEKGLVNDQLVLKRLVRPLIALNSDLDLFSFPDNVEDCNELKKLRNSSEETSYMRLYRVGSIGTIANLCVSFWMNDKNSSGVLLDEMKKGVIDTLAVHSSIIALDATRIVYAQNVKPFLSFQMKRDISDATEIGYIQYWPVLATFAVHHFVDKSSEILTSWLNQIIPLLFLGFNESMKNLASDNADSSSEENATFLLFGIRSFVTKQSDYKYNDETKSLILSIIFGFFLPVLNVSKDMVSSFLANTSVEYPNTSARTFSESFMHQSCGLLIDIYSCCLPELIKSFGDLLLHVILIPLGILQAGHFYFTSTSSEIIYSSIKCIHLWIKAFPSQDESFLKSMVHLSLSIYIQKDKQESLPSKIKDAVHDLFLECIDKLTHEDKINIAQEASRMGSWDLWKILCIDIKLESTVTRSFENIKIALSDVSSPNQHVPALAAISAIVQDTSYGNVINPLMHIAGVDVLSLLKMYGLNMPGYGDNPTYRTTVCADATRILMLAYQQLHSSTELEANSQEEKDDSNKTDSLSDYLKVLFTVLASLIDHNGLPNAIKENSGSDVALGRMCAQSIVHIVRTSPLAFKSSLIRVPERERGVLEIAVRAEMTGYSTSSSNKPSLPKKKLNLKSFRK